MPPDSPESQCTEEASLKNGLREHLACTTDVLLDEVMTMLRNESKYSTMMQAGALLQPCSDKLMAVPAFDEGVDYI